MSRLKEKQLDLTLTVIGLSDPLNNELDIINALYHDKTMNFIEDTFREKLISYH